MGEPAREHTSVTVAAGHGMTMGPYGLPLRLQSTSVVPWNTCNRAPTEWSPHTRAAVHINMTRWTCEQGTRTMKFSGTCEHHLKKQKPNARRSKK